MKKKSHLQKSRVPKYRQVFEEIQTAIINGRYAAGERVPSEAALVRRFKISRPTAARALQDLEKIGLVERRHGSGTFVRYVDQVRSGVLGLLVPGLGQGEIFEPICNEIARSVQIHGFTLFWGNSSVEETEGLPREKARKAEQLCYQYLDNHVAGVFFEPIELAPGMEEANQRIAEALEKSDIPVVLIDCDVTKFPERSKFDLVGIDNRRVGYVLTEHLLNLGCQRVDFVVRTLSAGTVDARIAGYREALHEHGISMRKARVHRTDGIDIDFVRRIVKKGLPDAFVCGNDYTAAQLMRDLVKQGVRVPEDIRLVGVDDLKYAEALSVPLTTIRQPCDSMGKAAVEAMIQRIANPRMPARDILLDFELVVRESCGCQS